MNLKKHLGYCLMMVMACVGVTMSSCSSSNETVEDKLENYISDNTDFVYKIDLARTLEALDATSNDDGQLTLSKDVSSVLRSALSKNERKAFDRFLDFKGFDWNNVIVGLKFKEIERDEVKMEMLLVFSVTDDDDFGESIVNASNGRMIVEDKNGYTTIGDTSGTIMVDGKTGYIAVTEDGICMPTQAAEIIENWHKEAKDNPLAEWKTKFLAEAKIGTGLMSMKPIVKAASLDRDGRQGLAMIPSEVNNGYIAMTFDVNGPSVSASLAVFNGEGGKVKIPGFRECNPSLTKYASNSDQLIACAGMGDLSQFRNQIIQAAPYDSAVIDFCNYILPLCDNSSVMFSAGAKDINAFTSSSPADFHMVFAASFKDASAARTIYDLIANNLGQSGGNEFTVQVPAGSRFNNYTYEYESIYMTVYGRIEGTDVILSNAPIQQNGKVRTSDFAGKNFAIVLNVPKNDPVLSGLNLPVGAKATLSVTGSETDAQISLTGTNKKLINALLEIAMGMGV